jgi:hypothetical protein
MSLSIAMPRRHKHKKALVKLTIDERLPRMDATDFRKAPESKSP